MAEGLSSGKTLGQRYNACHPALCRMNDPLIRQQDPCGLNRYGLCLFNIVAACIDSSSCSKEIWYSFGLPEPSRPLRSLLRYVTEMVLLWKR